MNLNLCTVLKCTDQPFIQHPLPLCRQHALMVSLNVTDVLHATALMGRNTLGLDVERATVASEDVWSQSSHYSVVYFLANGDRVKIGVSTNIAARVGVLSLRRGNALLLLQGGYDLEAALHDHFQADRIARTEWFVLSTAIRDYITDRKAADNAMRQPLVTADETDEPTTRVISANPPTKSATAGEKVLKALGDLSDPLGLKDIYQHKDQIAVSSGVQGATLDNTLSRLIKARQIHRQIDPYGKVLRGMYSLGAAPKPANPAF